MNEEEQLGGLYSIAQRQQAAAGEAVTALQQQAAAISQAVKAIGQATAALNGLPVQIAANSTKALREEAKHAIGEAIEATADTATVKAQTAAEKAARSFLAVTQEAAQASKEAAEAARSAVSESNWLFIGCVFLLGLALGAGGLYLLRTPKADVYLDTNRIAQEVAAACRVRR